MNNLLIVCGPTATGKTNLALKLAKQFQGEIVSCDSRQVYKEMDIVTGKDLPKGIKPEMASVTVKLHLPVYYLDGIPVWMYDVVLPHEDYSVSHFKQHATEVIADIHKRGKLPILVGGSGLYIDALVYGIETSTIPRNDQLRKQLDNMFVVDLQQMLQSLSPSSWEGLNNSDKNNPRRLIRKIEMLKSGVKEQITTNNYKTLWLGLSLPKELLEKNIIKRVQQRIEQGALEEVKKIVQAYTFSVKALDTIGYKEWREFLQNSTDLNYQKAINDWQTHEIQYTKRQMTWFKRKKDIVWLNMSDTDSENIARKHVQTWYN